MRKYIVLILGMLFSFSMNAQQKIVVNNSGNIMYAPPISNVDEITFDTNYSKFKISGETNTLNIQKAVIDSLTFTSSTVNPDKIYIIWNGTDDATIINPYSSQGVNISAIGGTVTVTATSGISDLEYNLLGTSSAGSLTMSSTSPAKFVLNNLNLTNSNGSAIGITGNQTHTFTLQSGTSNSLTDGTSSTKNGALQTNGKIIFNGTGSLSINGIAKHGISTSKDIEIQNGTITVTGAASDGLHSEGFTMSNGTLTVISQSDGIDAGDAAVSISGGTINIISTQADVKALKIGTNNISISGGSIDITVSGNQSKGISAKGNITFDGGTTKVKGSGNVVLTASGSGYDPSYCTAIKADGAITVNSGTINIEMTSAANGARGISADGEITINGGNVTVTTAGAGANYTNESGVADSYSCSAIKGTTNVKLLAGTINVTSTDSGGKGIKADGEIIIGNTGANNSLLTLNATTTGARFLTSGSGQNADYTNPKIITCDGNLTLNSGVLTITGTQTADGGEGLESKAILTINGGKTKITTWDDSINASTAIVINGGETYCLAKGNDGIDSNGTLTINGGFTISNGARAPEEGFDCDNNMFKITGGIIVGTGGNTSNPTSVSTQKSVKITTTASNNILIKNSAGTVILMYKVPAYTGSGSGNSVVLLFTDPAFVNGTYTVTRGGTITGGTTNHGYVTGGTYSGGTTTTFTVSNYLTTVN